MPIYEFYCCDCHMVFNFLSRHVNTVKLPDCPRCGRPQLERQVSSFAVSKGRKDEPTGALSGLDEEKLAKAMETIAVEMEGMDENDPRQMARFMRKLSDTTGMNLGAGAQEAMLRLEAGEDPEKIEEELGDIFTGENPLSQEGIKGLRKKFTPPVHDETFYVLD